MKHREEKKSKVLRVWSTRNPQSIAHGCEAIFFCTTYKIKIVLVLKKVQSSSMQLRLFSRQLVISIIIKTSFIKSKVLRNFRDLDTCTCAYIANISRISRGANHRLIIILIVIIKQGIVFVT